MSAVADEVAAWCQSYVEAFSAFDIDAIGGHWIFPALILQSGRTLAFDSVERFSKNTSGLLGFYEHHGVDRAERDLVDHLVLSPDAVSITVFDKMIDAAGKTIVTWQAAYVLQSVQGNWRAAVALADRELAAWAARGTPLGRV